MVNLSPAWLIAACVACLALLSFLIASTFSGKAADALPTSSIAALTPDAVDDSAIPPVHTMPPSPAVEAKAEPALTTPKSSFPTPAVKNKATAIILAMAKPASEAEMADPSRDPFAHVILPPEKAPAPERAVIEKPPVAPPPPLAKKPAGDPRVVDGDKLGTRIVFLRDPPEAFKTAGKERKLVFFVHLSGNFEDDAFT